MNGYAWKMLERTYRIQLEGVQHRSVNKICREFTKYGWRHSGHGVDTEIDKAILLFSKELKSRTDWDRFKKFDFLGIEIIEEF